MQLMVNEFQELSADEKCLSYIERILSSGRSLSKMLLEQVIFTKGKIYAVLPHRIEANQIKDFGYGGIGSAKESRRALAEVAVKYLDEAENQIVFEDGLAQASDPAVKNKEGAVFFDDEVYYVIKKISAVDHMERILKQVRYPIGILGVFSRQWAAGDPSTTSSHNINSEFLRNLVKAVEKTVIGAFDGEGYLLWSKE